MTAVSQQNRTVQFLLSGLVQGQGVRPTVARIARRQGLPGSVCNTVAGVEIVVTGFPANLDAFEHELKSVLMCRLVRQRPISPRPSEYCDGSFQILDSNSAGRLQTDVPLDRATCAECIAEFQHPTDRRYQYPLLSCTSCGPRYSILDAMPFDRDNTTMNRFPLCERCQAEYSDIEDRRFHAQTIACSDCGPQCWATDAAGRRVGGGMAAVDEITRQILQGKIAAVLGVGGYQLICDACSDAAVSELRRRKLRATKPLPILLQDANTVKRMTSVTATEESALCSPQNPIVILRCGSNAALSRHVSPGMNSIGVMLPTTPIHWYLAQRTSRALVVTSGNLHSAPLAYTPDAALEQLKNVADVFLHHNRGIVRPVDDSVVHCVGTHTMVLRAARGFAPMSFDFHAASPAVAVGAHQKVAIALGTTSAAVLLPHIGDMDSENSRIRFTQSVRDACRLYHTDNGPCAHDLHSEYFTTQWAKDHFAETSPVQHHHGHLAAAMLENKLLGETVLGVTFDGTGLGDDQTLWGGEFLLATCGHYRRVGHLRAFRLPGGEVSVKQPWRTALSILSQLPDKGPLWQWLAGHSHLVSQQHCLKSVERGVQTSSMGRLFDAVASIILGIERVSFEGEAAMLLEAACDHSETSAYRLSFTDDAPWQLDWRPMMQQLMVDRSKLDAGRIAAKFHRAVANAIVESARRYSEFPCLLSGGVFQNRTLLELIEAEASSCDLDIRLPDRVPVNDGGLALGQLVVQTAGQRRSESCV